MITRHAPVVATGLLFLFTLFLGCTNRAKNPSGPDSFQEQRKQTFLVPSDVDADLYYISITSAADGDSITYYQYAESDTLSISVPASDQSVVVVNAYKKDVLVFTGKSIAGLEDRNGLTKLTQQTIVPPAAPGAPSLAGSGNAVEISWTAADDVELYKIFRTYDVGSDPVFIGGSQSGSYTDTTVVKGIPAYYSISAVNAAGESPLSSAASVTVSSSTDPTDPTTVPPSTPESVVVTATSATTVSVSWQPVEKATAYHIYRTAENAVTSEKIAKTESTEYIDSVLNAGTAWGYSVSALNAAGESVQSTIIWTSTEITEPDTPEDIIIEAISEKSIRVSWKNVPTATSYKVEWSTARQGPFESDTTALSELVISQLNASTKYYCRVTATNSAGASEPSSLTSATTLAPPLQAPQSAPVLTTGSTSDSTIQLSWKPVTDAVNYIIEQAESANGSFTAICTTASFTCTADELEPSTKYYFRAVAENTAGTSDYSTPVAATTAASLLPPEGLDDDSISADAIILTWDAAENATSYNVYQTTATGSQYTLVGTTDKTGYEVSELSPGTTYKFKVSSVKGSAESPLSSSISVTTTEQKNAPPTPSGLAATAKSSTEIAITFSSVSDATSYKLYWSTDNNSFKSITLTKNTYTHSNLTADTKYYYKVTALSESLESEASSVISAQTEAGAAKKIAVIGAACHGCGKCVMACKTGAIKRSGRIYVIDASLCDGDGACINYCKSRAISLQ